MEIERKPIRPTLKKMRKGVAEYFPIEQYDSVVATVSRLNVTISNKRWSSAIVKDNPDSDTPISVRVTRIM